MSAEILRRAVADINAEWRNDDHTSDGRCKYPKSCLIDERHQKFADGAVALAVADWLDCVAAPFDQAWEPDEDGTLWGYDLDGDRLRFDESQDSLALAVARAYLGGDS